MARPLFSCFPGILLLVATISVIVRLGTGNPVGLHAETHVNVTVGVDDNIQNRIVGGRGARPGEIPYILSLQYYGRHVCGASFIRDANTGRHFVLTAAHCVHDKTAAGLTVKGGSLSLRQVQTTTQVLKVSKIVVHPSYFTTHGIPVNDVAILFLSGSFAINQNVKPISLPKVADEASDGKSVQASGWGLTNEGGSLSDNLQVVRVPVVDNAYCSKLYTSVHGNNQVIFKTNVCAGLSYGGKDTCQGDSGGPLVTGTKNPVLVGVTSWGEGCARPKLPGVYARVSTFVPWIMTTMHKNQ